MAMRTEDFKIKSENNKVENVSITTFSAMKGLQLGRRVVNLIAPILKSLNIDKKGKLDMKSIKDNFSKGDLSIETLIDALLKSTETDKLETLIFELVQTTAVGRLDLFDENNFNNIFSDNYGFLFKIVKKVFEVNLSSFFKKKSTGNVQDIETIS